MNTNGQENKRMKSIKEKAEESSLGFDEVQEPAVGRGFILGANYVLEQIEDIIVNNEDNTLNMARCLVDCIEQLKK